MSRLAIALALANLVAAAWLAGLLPGSGDGREPQRVARQVAPDDLRVVPLSRAESVR